MQRQDLFKLTERRLFRYSDNIKKLEEVNGEMEKLHDGGDVRAKQYRWTRSEHRGGIYDPVAEHVSKLITLEKQAQKLKKEIAPVKSFISDMELEKTPLAKSFLLFFRLFYVDKHPIKDISDGLNIPRRTLYARRKQIIKKCAKYSE